MTPSPTVISTPCRTDREPLSSLTGLRPLLLGICLWIHSSCGVLAPDSAPTPSPTPTPAATSTPNLVYEDITLTEIQPDGRTLWKVQASFARYEQDQAVGNAELDQVQGELYDSQNRPIRIQAQTGAIYPEEPRLELREAVEVAAGFYQVHLSADQVDWLPALDQLRAQGNVIVRSFPADPAFDPPSPSGNPTGSEHPGASTPSDSLTLTDLEARADQLIFDLQENQLSLSNSPAANPVEVTAASPPLDLTALKVIWDLDSQQLTAEGEVQGVHRTQQIQLTGDTLISPLITPEIAVVGNAEAFGQTTGQQLTADQLLWDTSTPVIQAQGNVFYRQPDQEMSLRGTSGTLNWETSTVAVQGSSTTTQLQVP